MILSTPLPLPRLHSLSPGALSPFIHIHIYSLQYLHSCRTVGTCTQNILILFLSPFSPAPSLTLCVLGLFLFANGLNSKIHTCKILHQDLFGIRDKFTWTQEIANCCFHRDIKNKGADPHVPSQDRDVSENYIHGQRSPRLFPDIAAQRGVESVNADFGAPAPPRLLPFIFPELIAALGCCQLRGQHLPLLLICTAHSAQSKAESLWGLLRLFYFCSCWLSA